MGKGSRRVALARVRQARRQDAAGQPKANVRGSKYSPQR
jgi:hypothetical protein